VLQIAVNSDAGYFSLELCIVVGGDDHVGSVGVGSCYLTLLGLFLVIHYHFALLPP
jgi:hypothetical protein